MSEIDYSQLVTFAQFAEKIGIKTAVTVQKWADAESVKPVFKAGVTNVYLMADLQRAMENHSANADHFRKLGYVHPDQHKEVMDHRDRLAVELAKLHTEVEALRKRDAFLYALEEAGVDNWEGYETACSIESGEMSEDDI